MLYISVEKELDKIHKCKFKLLRKLYATVTQKIKSLMLKEEKVGQQ